MSVSSLMIFAFCQEDGKQLVLAMSNNLNDSLFNQAFTQKLQMHEGDENGVYGNIATSVGNLLNNRTSRLQFHKSLYIKWECKSVVNLQKHLNICSEFLSMNTFTLEKS